MMKILILTNDANGLYLFRKELIKALKLDGYEVLVSLPPDENCKKIESLEVEILETPFERRGNNPIKDIKLFQTYCGLLKEQKPGLVLTYTIKPNLYGGLACRLRNIPYICNITGLGTAIENKSILSYFLLKFYRIATKKAHCVFFQNNKNRQFMQKFGIAVNNSCMLPGSGVNLTEHPFKVYPSEEGGICFLAVIRIMKDKGIEEYLEAAQVIKQKHPNTLFYLVGEYEEETRQKYEQQIRELEEKHVVKYFGHVNNVQEIMAESHIIVHPSYHEGLSNVLLEAAACGRPVLASNIHGCIETFIPDVSGIAFEPRNAASLVESMEKILSFPSHLRQQMGIEARAFVEQNFDRNIVIEAYRKKIKSLFEGE